MGKPATYFVFPVDSRSLLSSILFLVMSNPVFRRLTNGELILDYTEAARRVKLSRGQVRMNTAEKKSLTAEEVGIKNL